MAFDGPPAIPIHCEFDFRSGNRKLQRFRGSARALACSRLRPRSWREACGVRWRSCCKLSLTRADREGAVSNTRSACAPLFDEVQPGVAALLRVGDAPQLSTVAQLTGVANLPAHLRVSARSVEHNRG